MLREACIVKKQLATLNEIGIVTLKGNQLDQQYHNPHTLPPKLLLPFKHCRLQVPMSITACPCSDSPGRISCARPCLRNLPLLKGKSTIISSTKTHTNTYPQLESQTHNLLWWKIVHFHYTHTVLLKASSHITGQGHVQLTQGSLLHYLVPCAHLKSFLPIYIKLRVPYTMTFTCSWILSAPK